MINKRLLIKNLLAQQDENSFFDKKRQLNLHTKEGKGKFLKHICALSNSNPNNNSYILVGIEDETNSIIGTDFYDDSRIQNLVNAYLEHAPKIQYENIAFPKLEQGKVVGLVTIFPKRGICFFIKKCHVIQAGTFYSRVGSTTVPEYIEQIVDNREVVESIENNSRNNLQDVLDNVVRFMTETHPDMKPHYNVFKEYFILCWAGKSKYVHGKKFLSRVDIVLINDEVKLFYSALDEVIISYTEEEFVITEYVRLGLKESSSYYPFSRQTLHFYDNMTYAITSEIIFQTPEYNPKMLTHIYRYNLSLLEKIKRNRNLTANEQKEAKHLPYALMICYLNGFEDSKDLLIDAKNSLKSFENKKVFIAFKEVMRILRKLKYENQNE